MTAPVCYLERRPGGLSLRRVRLVTVGGERTWEAPESEPADGVAVRAELVAAAAWTIERLAEVSRRPELAAVVLDPGGSTCLWLTAPSGDARVLSALLTEDAGGEPASGAAADWEPAAAWASPGRSLHALADGPAPRAAAATRRRVGVLSVADLAARVFLDELDRRAVEVHAVLAFPHAAAIAFDPSGETAWSGVPSSDAGAAAVVAESAPVTASVIADPAGWLAWSWSRGGRVVAAGTQRLRIVEERAPEPDPATIDPGATASRRMPAPESPTSRHLVLTTADVGRLVVEWLAWAMQLAQAPSRVACLGPEVPANELGAIPLEELARAIGRTWPGTVDVATDADPIGIMLRRLAAGRAAAPAPARAAAPAGAADLHALTNRPGRAHRAMYRWSAVAIAAAAVAVGVLGLRVGARAEAAEQRVAALLQQRSDTLEAVAPFIPGVKIDPDPVRLIRSRLVELTQKSQGAGPERPVMAAVREVFEATNGVTGVRLRRLSIGTQLGASVVFEVDDTAAGETLGTRIRRDDSVVDWRYQIRSVGAARECALTGSWLEPAPRPAPGTPASPPAPAGGVP